MKLCLECSCALYSNKILNKYPILKQYQIEIIKDKLYITIESLEQLKQLGKKEQIFEKNDKKRRRWKYGFAKDYTRQG